MSLKNSSVAIYRQIIEYFELEIASGRLKAGDRIESIRALALFFKVNPNTVQKALNELERDGLIETDRTNGKFVTDKKDIIKKLRSELGRRYSVVFVEKTKTLGLDLEETLSLLKHEWEVGKDE
ncbi:GntR family transcriptional regulator [Erysipelothrix rhusiopathiae]|uniref:Transcriptional regulator, GntR family n=1 Tax=Erysipelothrix rhusiopathiae ATCC 19414 TaxID=525280 RepID=E7FWN2_ERYRH|nr:GntR family transcriptional regulator [Erysipelothrix rhusiopathiae]EFY08758.1 transcriptional regulator, GntR family [Erysipelothrix rhusiopathiae ATCC 19414]MDE8226744.1 GntR family transcriptional regulator [Erysipelothrix rhusiopathiae]MDE8255982.1 GntR family transcriptional regulator [Erysipelothrix rhusiopathiae]MDE8339021.1 GntR family transcriptional regulator [Erysipelothrix rhusiopathiae]MDV7680317.1 GntR family transcriptional regulator [Erysipelothrix rhusiopathiae]